MSGVKQGPVPAGRRARPVLQEAERLLVAARAVVADRAAAADAVRSALAPLQDELARAELEPIPLSRLRDVTEGRLRLGALEQAGFTTVAQVYDAGRYALRQLPGVGAQTADQAIAAAGQIARAVGETVTVRIDMDRPEPRTTALVRSLHVLAQAGPGLRHAHDTAQRLRTELDRLLPQAGPARGRVRTALAGRARRAEILAALEAVRCLTRQAAQDEVPLLFAQVSADLLRVPASDAEAWVGFELHSADYYSLLAEFAGQGPDPAAAEGFVPSGIAGRIRAQQLDESRLRVSLRGYQSFGARFALVQRRVIIGDEMGLGKTVQAIAAMAHLSAGGTTHFLVVCPASVLINWMREVGSRSTLTARPVHGPGRRTAFAEWCEQGGVAITTFDVLHLLDVPDDVRPGMLVVDEAHFVKNPLTRRAKAVAAWTGPSDRVLFLTGTPMENRVEEFRSLVRRLQPELVPAVRDRDAAAGSQAFRRAVAPAYLRRNQEDVLTELPALVHVDEWEEFSAGDLAAYREAVADGHFMRMRRAAYARPESSAKLGRLRELISDAAANGLKVVVFSYFRDVLATVGTALDGTAYGPVEGDLAAARRQDLVDAFSAAPGHAVLLSQFQAGGVGLNIQAASVVILCEPQIKPSMEHQAVARAHRMGQVRTVRVHRLLAADSVDTRILGVLADKTRLFDAYARRSEVAEATPDAVDVSDGSLARRIVEEEQLRLFMSERRIPGQQACGPKPPGQELPSQESGRQGVRTREFRARGALGEQTGDR
ncbi:DEAD/DEAH box helicase [Streptomyces sp. NBC_00859]|uniref:DEAD/DEAH box helicase n=1 Tax=Streptomyces sp. NBC_00859 TaxID=2903682 RepID=UPI00386D3CCC|nr:DEAD/DEAH box helicase [Streptomyces sp. NBC_00859]